MPLPAGLSVKAFDESDQLRDFFNVISVTADRDGVFYVSTMEAKKVNPQSYFLNLVPVIDLI